MCRSTKEQEEKRVDKEMAHIRSKFTSETHMNGYQRKKYVWKILYMYMLGYEVDFGHMEAVNLVSSPKYSEKCAACHAGAARPRPARPRPWRTAHTAPGALAGACTPAGPTLSGPLALHQVRGVRVVRAHAARGR